ncbi:MAG TPA: DUF4179 domain-containing protein [Steroidobacteraceae bacterium]|nr:DUF4179 domain-containing protein [Steroidobacteraceae bacterium]
MKSSVSGLLVAALFAFGTVSTASAADAPDPVIGTWVLNVSKSKFMPGPAPKSQTRTYAATAEGVEMTVNGVSADGKTTASHSTYAYGDKDFPITGSADYDTLQVKRVDANTASSIQKKAGKVVGHATRTVSKDGKMLTLASKGTDAKGAAYDNLAVFDRK